MLYLIHLDQPIHHAQHYIGASGNIASRLQQHARGTGARLLKAAMERGIEWQLARLWSTLGFDEEKLIKKMKNGRQYCPICNQMARLYGKYDSVPLSLIDYPLHSTQIREMLCTKERTKEEL